VSGTSCVAIGNATLSALTTGNNVTAIGAFCAEQATTASSCTAVGYKSMDLNVTSNNVTAIGAFAGQKSTGSNGTFVGYSAGINVSGTSNTGVGASALTGAVSATASFNCAFGIDSLVAISSGAGNVCAGYNTGNAISSGSYNLCFGYQCGSTNLTTGSNNIFLVSGVTPYAPANPSNTLWIGANVTGNLPVISATGLQATPAVLIPGVLTVGSFGATHFTANGTTATSLTSLGPAGAHATVQEWLTIVDSGGTTRYIPCF
jgi:hypothetical protein